MKILPNQRLRIARNALSLTMREFAAPLGLHPATICKWESGKINIPAASLHVIERVYGISSKWILDGEGEPGGSVPVEFIKATESAKQSIGVFNNISSNIKNVSIGTNSEVIIDNGQRDVLRGNPSDFVPIPMILLRPFAENRLYIEAHPSVEDSLLFNKNWLQKTILVPIRYLSLVLIEDDSMSPALNPKDIALVDRSAHSLGVTPGIWIFRLENSIFIRCLHESGNGIYRAVSDNEKHPPFDFHLYKTPDLIIMGKVIWICKAL